MTESRIRWLAAALAAALIVCIFSFARNDPRIDQCVRDRVGTLDCGYVPKAATIPAK